MNIIHQVLSYADNLNLTGENIRTIERNADALLIAYKDIRLAIKQGKLNTWNDNIGL